jgi:hypothetical protein
VRSQLPEREAEPARYHLAGCARCREVHNALLEEAFPAASEPAPRADDDPQATVLSATRPSGLVATVQPSRQVPVVCPSNPAPEESAPGPALDGATGETVQMERLVLDSERELLARLAPAQAEDELGRLGPYRLLRQLGAGATGVVFLAEDVNLRRQVALKVMKPIAEEAWELARQRFLREGRAAALLESDYTVPIYQVGEEAGLPFLAMKLLVGEALDTRLQRDKELKVHEVLRIGREVAEGLAAAHERGLVHRDVKPANIFLEANGEGSYRVRLVDFGLARGAIEDVNLTRTGTIVGRPAYMSPEQARGTRVDFRSDLFSLGCVLYKMCSGRTPFKADDTLGMLVALNQDQPPPLKSFNPDLPDELVGLVNSLLAKLPEGRPESARFVADVLAILAERAAADAVTGPKAVSARAARKTVVQMLVLAVLSGVGFWYGPTVYKWGRGEVERILKESARPRGPAGKPVRPS